MEGVVGSDTRIEDALQRSIELGEVGVQVAAYLGDELIVDAWAGIADTSTGRPVDALTLFAIFSVTKAILATALHLQAERGLIDYRAPVARYWPEFATNDKAATTVRDVLSHRAGVPWMPEGTTPELQSNWDWMIRRIEQMEPSYEPGTTNCYHALTWGWIVGELVCRTDPQRRSIDAFVRDELLDPLGIQDLHIGLPDTEVSRVAPAIGGEPPADASELYIKGMPRAVFPSASVYNDDFVRRSIIPGAGAIANARSVARVFALLANHGALGTARLLSSERVDSLLEPRDDADRIDLYHQIQVNVTASGYRYASNSPSQNPAVGPNPCILWHPGAGGSVAWAELDTGLAVAICHNHMHGAVDPAVHPFVPIADAVRAVATDRLVDTAKSA